MVSEIVLSKVIFRAQKHNFCSLTVNDNRRFYNVGLSCMRVGHGQHSPVSQSAILGQQEQTMRLVGQRRVHGSYADHAEHGHNALLHGAPRRPVR